MFVNRTAELERLHARYGSGRAELFVLYGRRVGKTGLLREFCRDKPHIFFVATLSSDRDQLAAFSQQIWLCPPSFPMPPPAARSKPPRCLGACPIP